MGEAKKGGGIGRVILLIVLLALVGGGGWYWNDMEATDAVNEATEKINSANRALVGGGGDVAGVRTNMREVVEAGGGRGPLHFMSRGEIQEHSVRNHQLAAALLAWADIYAGDVAAARTDVQSYKSIRDSYGQPNQNAEGIAGCVDRLLATEGIDQMSREDLQAAVFAGMAAAALRQ